MSEKLSIHQFALLLGAVLAAIALSFPAMPSGDFDEYALMTFALAGHGTPAIQSADLQTASRLASDFNLAYEELGEGMRAGAYMPRPGFFRGRDGEYFSIHFYAYSALAVAPFRLLQAAGMAPLKCFQVVNLGFVFVLGLCLFRLFGTATRAALGVLLFFLCGGLLYWRWTSPECMCAAALLSALILFATGAPRAGGLLAGLAAMQNPPIGLFIGFAPLFHAALHYRAQAGWRAALRGAVCGPNLHGLLLVLALALLPILFSLWQFAAPNMIARYATSHELISMGRLVSFFFDLNQGMLVGLPAVLAALLWWGWRAPDRRSRAVLVLCGAFALALAVPALTTHNWNSGATGMMRYAFWAAMPFLFALMLRLRALERWPRVPVAALLLAQLACMAGAANYSHVQFSPQAQAVLALAPGLYNPDPEIFAERVAHSEAPMDLLGATIYRAGGIPTKTMYLVSAPGIDARLCGPGRTLSPANRYVDLDRHFRYINGPVLCIVAG